VGDEATGHLLGRGQLGVDEPRDREDSPHRDRRQRAGIARRGRTVDVGRRARDGAMLAIRQAEEQLVLAAGGGAAGEREGSSVEGMTRIGDRDRLR
jgi:hypothetical protein